MNEKTFGNITIQTDNPFLMNKFQNYTDLTIYTEQNVNILSFQLINMTTPNTIIDSFADYQTAGTISISFNDITAIPETVSSVALHHDGFEFHYVLCGNIQEQIENTSYDLAAHEAILMNCGCRKLVIPSPNSIFAIITISRQYFKAHAIPDYYHLFFSQNLSDVLSVKPDFLIMKRRENNVNSYSYIDVILHSLFDELRKKEVGYDEMVYGLLKRLLSSLDKPSLYYCKRKHISLSVSDELVDQMKSFLDTNPRKVSVKELSDRFHYHRDYLSRIFIKKTYSTIKQYNTTIYMKEAYRLITQTDMPISKISTALGFQSRAQFYKVFESYYHYSPGKLR